jgi:hypothetical protein
VARVLG